MSVEYYFACSRCKEVVHIGCTSNIDPFFQYHWSDQNCSAALQAFLARHTLCGEGAGIEVALIDEYSLPGEFSEAEWDWAESRPSSE